MKKKKELDYSPCCALCDKATILEEHSEVLCSKKGIVDENHICRKFLYDPLKRVPSAQPSAVFSDIKPEDLDL